MSVSYLKFIQIDPNVLSRIIAPALVKVWRGQLDTILNNQGGLQGQQGVLHTLNKPRGGD